MKTLTLLRHAKASWGERGSLDFDRPLNPKGQRAARTMGKAMREAGLTFDRVVASPAVRVTETIDGAEQGYGRALDPDYDHRVYLASPEMLLELVHQADDADATILIVGHNPGLEALALVLTRDGDNGLRAEIEVKYPTGTLAELHLPVDHWRDVRLGIGSVARFIRPRDLDPALRPERD